MVVGRFAPSPTGPLHLGNLRTALIAWLRARQAGGSFIVRMEDLDPVTSSPQWESHQLAALAAMGLDWDGEVVRQSERFDRYNAALAQLQAQDLVYPCFCSRREIQAEIANAAQAPHDRDGPGGPADAYPGTCATLDAAGRRRRADDGRPPALRVRASGAVYDIVDLVRGRVLLRADDFVVRRNDGVPAYQLAVVVDDSAQGITEVVRGEDLLESTPRQRWLQDHLGLEAPTYVHVPLAVGPDGQRLAKRHGAVTLDDLAAQGIGAEVVLDVLAASLGMPPDPTPSPMPSPTPSGTARRLADRFDLDLLPRHAWVVTLGVDIAQPGAAGPAASKHQAGKMIR